MFFAQDGKADYQGQQARLRRRRLPQARIRKRLMQSTATGLAQKPICSVEGCGRVSTVISRSLCVRHYKRFMRHGNALGGGTSPGAGLEWLLAHVDYTGDGCLIYPFGRMTYGYACTVQENGQSQYAHRKMCELAHGPSPSPDHETAHNCGKGHEGCVHPQHLRWATRQSNNDDMDLHGTRHRIFRLGWSAEDALAGRRARRRSAAQVSIWREQVASRADPDRVALSQAGKRSAAARKIRKREAIELAGQLVLFAPSSG